jgi:hypothetical protein
MLKPTTLGPMTAEPDSMTPRAPKTEASTASAMDMMPPIEIRKGNVTLGSA